jgi:hypothetical protein
MRFLCYFFTFRQYFAKKLKFYQIADSKILRSAFRGLENKFQSNHLDFFSAANITVKTLKCENYHDYQFFRGKLDVFP